MKDSEILIELRRQSFEAQVEWVRKQLPKMRDGVLKAQEVETIRHLLKNLGVDPNSPEETDEERALKNMFSEIDLTE